MEVLEDPPESSAELRVSPPPEPLDVLFVMPRLNFLRFFQSPLDLMIERGVNVRLLLESRRSDDPGEHAWLERAETRPNFVCEIINHFKADPLRDRRIQLRVGMEYVRRMAPTYANRVAGRPRTRLSRAPRTVRRLVELPLIRSPRGLRGLYGLLALLDRALPRPAAATAYVERLDPDLVVVCDKGHPGSLSSAYVKAAQERAIPTAVCVASWDNLTNRQRTRVVPDALLVWNERQQQEALDFHGIPGERVAITGAPRFDDWFSWQARDREEFLSRVGLDPAHPVILWVGCALNPAELTEAQYVAGWIARLRASDDPLLRDAGVIIRPHPERFADWVETDYSSFTNVSVWPADGMRFPLDVESKADYYDSIFHASAVVGINTSAMIEASIIGRPVLTVLVPEFHDSQQATFHFSYLVQSEGGPVRLAQSMEEHLVHLGEAVGARDTEAAERARRFVAGFVRPHGLERAATEIFVETLEQLAQTSVQRRRDPLWLLPLRAVLVFVTGAERGLSDLRHGSTRRYKRFIKRCRGFTKKQRRRVRMALRIRRKLLRKRLRRVYARVRRIPAAIVRRAGRLRKRIRERWWEHGQPHLSRALKQPDRLRLSRAGVGGVLAEFMRQQPEGALRPDYSDLLYLYELVRERRPDTVLEFGSGCSTAVIATALERNGRGHLWSVEGDEEWARATQASLPEPLQPFVTVTYSPVREDDRDVPGWSYERVPAVEPDFVYLDGPPHTRERKVAFDLLDMESRLRPGCMVVVDGRGRNAYYLRDHFRRQYAFVEQAMRWRHMYRFTFELLEPEPPALPREDARPLDTAVGS